MSYAIVFVCALLYLFFVEKRNIIDEKKFNQSAIATRSSHASLQHCMLTVFQSLMPSFCPTFPLKISATQNSEFCSLAFLFFSHQSMKAKTMHTLILFTIVTFLKANIRKQYNSESRKIQRHPVVEDRQMSS